LGATESILAGGGGGRGTPPETSTQTSLTPKGAQQSSLQRVAKRVAFSMILLDGDSHKELQDRSSSSHHHRKAGLLLQWVFF